MFQEKFFVSLALFLFFFLCLFSVINKYVTIDESVYIPAGYSYIKTLDFRINPEHPVFGKMLFGIPQFLLGAELPLQSEDWKKVKNRIDVGAYYSFAYEFWKLNLNRFKELLLASRIVSIVASLVMALTLFLWIKKLSNFKAAFFALLLYIFEPNVIAHSRLATLDILLSLFFFLTFFFLWKFFETKRKQFMLASFAFLSFAFLTKYPGLAAFAIIPIFTIFYHKFSKPVFETKRELFPFCFAFVLIPLFIMHLIYLPDSVHFGYRYGIPRRVWEGLSFIYNWSSEEGREGYLLGEFHRFMPHYFFFCMLFKSTIPMLLMLALSFYILRREKQAFLFLLPGLLFFIMISLKVKFYLGYRYVLPSLPFFIGFISLAFFRASKKIKNIFVILLAFHILSSLLAFPHYISYFNELATLFGKEHLLTDSNIDWGQDIFYFLDYIKKHNIKDPLFAYFAWPDPNLFAKVHYAKACKPEPIKIFVSVTTLTGVSKDDNCFRWLLNYKPKAIIGGSIYYYEIR